MLDRILKYLSTLGEKSSRTDIWVILISLTFISCLFGLVACTENWYVTTILGGMFLDLGINTVAKNLLKDVSKHKDSKNVQ